MLRSHAAIHTGPFSRRSFFLSAAGGVVLPVTPTEPMRLFMTQDYEIRMTLEFYDHYASNGFWFQERLSHRDFCFSPRGEQDRSCLENFTGAVAVARYRVRPRVQSLAAPTLRELVRSIDGSERFPFSPPFERTITLQQGIASDVQVFGYQSDTATPGGVRQTEKDDLWCLLRQDLYFKGQAAPFLVLHWKHTLRAIRVLDMIPGTGTSMIENGRGK